MNLDDSSYTCKVVSKYFSGKTAMDESLSDFQDKKTNNTGPKNTLKSNTNKNKSKKPPKRIRGQKDIRTVLKKKNELISYTKEFDNVCKQTGVDVDSEQLQLAIALSKSLQQTESTSASDSSQSYKSGSQERVGKICKTLQQYGFKVPDIKIATTVSRKVKKYKKHYKLLSITESERNQIITDKYSQLLLRNLEKTKFHDSNINLNVTNLILFHKASNISYNCMKNIDTFYVDNLMERSRSTGCLLKNWSDIPGRPESPQLIVHKNMNFSEIECSQDELDVILSGSLKRTKTIFNSKHKSLSVSINNKCNESIIVEDDGATKLDDNSVLVIEHEVSKKDLVDESEEFSNEVVESYLQVKDTKSKPLTVAQQCRSCSPDIFDDELSVLNSTKTIEMKTEEEKVVEESNNFMDLTECVNVPYKSLGIKRSQKKTQLSQKSDITKRKSCDFMEITECIASSLQPILVNHEKIDLTQSSGHDDKNEVVGNDGDKIESMDLTQSSNTSDELPFVQIDSQMQKSLDDTILLNDSEYLDLNKEKIKPDIEEIDLSLGKYSSPVEFVKNLNPASFFEEYIHDHSDKSKELSESDEPHITKSKNDSNKESEKTNIDLTQSSNSEEYDDQNSNSIQYNVTPKILCNNISSGKKDVSIDYDELFDSIDKSKTISTINSPNISLIYESSSNLPVYDINNDDIEIQNPLGNTSDCMDPNLSQNSEVFEIVDQEFDYSLHKSRIDNPKDNFLDDDEVEIQSENTSNGFTASLRKSSEALQIPDQELDYSFHKSRCNLINFEFGGISIMDNFSSSSSFRKTINNVNNSISLIINTNKNDSYLPVVDLKKAITNTETPQNGTPNKENNKNNIPFKTPLKKDYIIKTDEVTPMLDYTVMSTPEMNKELDKYGLKPFKRKRAIKLLTHIYNQTHPIVESSDNDDQPSPSKKPKHSTNNSPIKKLRSPKITPELNKSGGFLDMVYEETNALPHIKETDCDEDDWIFQKREKVKVHSCRVPLHIAFHNYVLSRRGLREAILRYEPVNIDVIHKDLVGYGHRYDPKDLLKFMDKKCITVKTADNNSRNNNK